MNLARFYTSRPARAALVAVLVTAAVGAVVSAGAFFLQPSTPDTGALPLTGSEVVLRVGVMTGVFLAVWFTVMISALLRRPAADV